MIHFYGFSFPIVPLLMLLDGLLFLVLLVLIARPLNKHLDPIFYGDDPHPMLLDWEQYYFAFSFYFLRAGFYATQGSVPKLAKMNVRPYMTPGLKFISALFTLVAFLLIALGLPVGIDMIRDSWLGLEPWFPRRFK